MFPIWLQAGFWGLVAGSALLIGAAIGFYIKIPQRIIAGIMAFGSGVLISALSFELMDEAYKLGGFDSMAIGFVGGAVVFTGANWFVNKKGQSTGKGRASNNLLKGKTMEVVYQSRSARCLTAYRNQS